MERLNNLSITKVDLNALEALYCDTNKFEDCQHYKTQHSGCWECKHTYSPSLENASPTDIEMPTFETINTVGAWDAFK